VELASVVRLGPTVGVGAPWVQVRGASMEPLLWALYRTRGVTELDISHSKVDHVFFSFFIFLFPACFLYFHSKP
jgi:hypothetical protein